MNRIDQNAAQPETEALVTAYSEICKSYHAIDDFRMKLLGLLPLASLAGIVLLDDSAALSAASDDPNELIGFVSLFAAAFALSLFIYEIRGILRCDGLIKRGREIEDVLKLRGQFWQCEAEASAQANAGLLPIRASSFFNTTVAACTLYSMVIAAWVFLGLRYGYGHAMFGCALLSVGLGLVLGILSYFLVRQVVPA